ncbi:ferrous iron transport protein A [Herbaspirillum sp. HC18]|nr:ferrous iron transport protein A [Herbaspirillum sp. HC18]
MSNGIPAQQQDDNLLCLSHLKKGDAASVIGMVDGGGEEHAAMRRRLLELGFVEGEKIRIIAESFPRRDPIAVRVGNTTFALRRHEASLIRVMPWSKPN